MLPNWRGDFCQRWRCYEQWELESWPVPDWMGATVRDLGLALGGMFSFWHGIRVGSLVRTNKQAGVVFASFACGWLLGCFDGWICKTVVVVVACFGCKWHLGKKR